MVYFHGKADMTFLVPLIFLMLDGTLMCSTCLIGIVGSVAVNVAGVSVLLQQFIGKQRSLLKNIYDVSNIDYSRMLHSINQVSEDLSNHNGFIGSQAHTAEFFAALQLATERVLFENADTETSDTSTDGIGINNDDSEEVDDTEEEEEEDVEETAHREGDCISSSDSGEESSSSDENITCRVSSSSVEEEELEMTEEEKAERLRLIETITDNSEIEAKVRIDESESRSTHESTSSSSSSKNEVNDLPFLNEMTVVY